MQLQEYCLEKEQLAEFCEKLGEFALAHHRILSPVLGEGKKAH